MQIRNFTFNSFGERCSVIWDNHKNSAIIDPGFCSVQERNELFDFIEKNSLEISAVLLTHGHFDHVFGVAECEEYFSAPIYMNKADEVILTEANPALCNAFGLPLPKQFIQSEKGYIHASEGSRIRVGELCFEVIETPGHTPGGVCYLERSEKTLFSGDTLFAGSIGRTDNQWADYDSLMSGIFNKLMKLDGDITVIPGHGPNTSIAEERTTNPFLMPFNEPFEM